MCHNTFVTGTHEVSFFGRLENQTLDPAGVVRPTAEAVVWKLQGQSHGSGAFLK